MATTEVGHHWKMPYLSQDGQLVIPSSAKLRVEPGGIFAPFGASTGTIETCTGKTGTITNRGITIIKSSAVGVLTLANPTAATIGCVKTLIFDTSAAIHVRAAQTVGAEDIKFTSSACVLTLGSGAKFSHKTINFRPAVTLLAQSTSRWQILTINPAMSTSANFWLLSSTTG